ncbi:MAG TPA: hypothetical protein VHT96_18580, partial [Clostridia bacterium]|nr:hypothetical protein [Clostridia bacterium]
MAKFKVDTTVLTDRALKLNGLTSRIKSLQDSVNRVTVNLSSCSYYDQFSSALRKVYIDIQTLSNNVQYFSKVLILMLGTVILFSTVSGCSLKKEALVIPKEEAVEARGKELTNVLQAILKERKFNGKSIEWDGIQATLVRDELDDKNILDGRSGLFEVKEIDTATGITLYSFSTPNNEDLFSEGSLPVVDNPEEYILKSSNRYLSLKKQDITNYDALAEESSTDTQLIEL